MDNELLKYAIENGIIDLSYVQDVIAMKKREELLQKHPYDIWQGKDNKWRTYLPDEEKGRKLVKRSTRNSIEDAIIQYYKTSDDRPKTFDDMYKHWREVQDVLVSDNTIAKYDTDYIRYFKDTDFISKKVESITEEDIVIFIVNKVKELKLCKKACKTLFGYIKRTIRSARINRIIKEDPMQFLEANQFYKYCTEKEKNVQDRIVSDEDMQLLLKQIQEDNQKHPDYIPVYAVHLAMLTGMRVGELAALSWDRITNDYIIIDRSEKYTKGKREFFIDVTKNGKQRIFPMTDEIRELLNQVKKVEIQYGMIGEWVFSNENGRVHAPVISSCMKTKCIQLGINPKGIHALRRTLNSKMRCDGISSTVAASLLGHSKEVNEQYYTYDITDIKEKAGIISKINKQIV